MEARSEGVGEDIWGFGVLVFGFFGGWWGKLVWEGMRVVVSGREWGSLVGEGGVFFG